MFLQLTPSGDLLCVSKLFGKRYFDGTVKLFRQEQESSLWMIEYDDNDTEEMEEKELKKAMEDYETYGSEEEDN